MPATLEKPLGNTELKSANPIQKIETKGANNIVNFIRKNNSNSEAKTEQLATIPKAENAAKNFDGFAKPSDGDSTILDVKAEQVGQSVIELMSKQNLEKINASNKTETYFEPSNQKETTQPKLETPREIKGLLPPAKDIQQIDKTKLASKELALTSDVRRQARDSFSPNNESPIERTASWRGLAAGKPEYLPVIDVDYAEVENANPSITEREELKVTNTRFIDNQTPEFTGNKPSEEPFDNINQVKQPQRLSTLEIDKLKEAMRVYAQNSRSQTRESIQEDPVNSTSTEISPTQQVESINSGRASLASIRQNTPAPTLFSSERSIQTNILPTSESSLVRTSSAIQEVSNRESFNLPRLPEGSANNIPGLFSSAQSLYDDIQNHSEMSEAVNLCVEELLEEINPELVYESLGIELDQSLDEEEQKANLKVALGFVVVLGLISNEGILDQMNNTKPNIENSVSNPDLAAIFQLGIKNADTFNHANKTNKEYTKLFETKYSSNPELRNQAFGEAYLNELTNNLKSDSISRSDLVPQFAYLLATKQSEIDLRNPETNQLYTFNDIVQLLEQKGVAGILEKPELVDAIGKVTTNDVLIKENS
jgi:hypothetical protein